MTSFVEIQCIALLVAVSCGLSGVFFVLRHQGMLIDSISHSILLGIVLAFFVVKELHSPWLFVGATAMGVGTVWLTGQLKKSCFLNEDAAIGLVYPCLFSVAVLLITLYADSLHLDTDAVLLGELAFAPFDRLVVGGQDIGAKSLYTSGFVCLMNVAFLLLCYKELQISTFDPMLTNTLGLSTKTIEIALTTLVSLTAVSAFESVGSVLVLALMVGPSLSASLLTHRLPSLLCFSGIFAVVSTLLGVQIAFRFDVSIGGSMAVMVGVLFFCVFLLAPQTGFVSHIFEYRKRKKQLLQRLEERELDKKM